MLSGERITAIIAAVGLDGKISIYRCLRDEVIEILFKENSKDAIAMLQWVKQSIERHLANAGSFSDWESPISGFHIGEYREAFTNIVESVPQLVTPLCSSFSTVELAETCFQGVSTEFSLDRWKNAIKHSVLLRLPRLKENFSKQIFVIDGARQHRIDYAGIKVAANFGRLSTSHLARCVRDTKAQILDLVTYKERRDYFKDEDCKILIWTPRDSTLPDQKHGKLVYEAFLEIEEESKQFGLRAITYTDPDLAASEILLAEMAA